MVKRFLVFFLALLAGGSMSANAPEGVFPWKTTVITLDNGLTAVMIPMTSGGLMTYYSIVRTGSRDEYEEGKSGFAHFFEHMMFRGTKNFPSSVYDRMVTEIGANANAYTTDDYTAYHLSSPGGIWKA
jgi:zinc protease